MPNYHQQIKIPVRIIETPKTVKRVQKNNKKWPKIVGSLVLTLSLILTNTLLFTAYESHIINVTAHICEYSEIKSMGYWKNHPNIYVHYLPQNLGDEVIDSVPEANQVFLDYNLSMRNKLKGQLLAIKFNIAHFGIGEYFVESEGKTINEIVAYADELLRNPDAPPEELERIKDLLDYLNSLEQIRFCRIPPPVIEEYIVINEVYYDVKCHGEEGWNEWVEIYNPTDEAVNISGWKIADNGGEDVIPSSNLIPAQGFAVITPKASTWTKWPSISPETVKIVLGSKIGNGLANDGDRVVLINNFGTEVDAVSYGTDTYAFDPSVPDVAEGHSIARSPKGFDTDQASDWVDLKWPNPGTNPHIDDDATIFVEEEIGCAEGDIYIPEERDTSEDEELLVEEMPAEELPVEESSTEELPVEELPIEAETTNPTGSSSTGPTSNPTEETPNDNSPEEGNITEGTTDEGLPPEETTTEEVTTEEPAEEPVEETTDETLNSEETPEEANVEQEPSIIKEEESPVKEPVNEESAPEPEPEPEQEPEPTPEPTPPQPEETSTSE